MSLAIDKFVTRCRAPIRHRSAASVADGIARERLPAELALHLGPSLSRLPAVVRIRRVRVRLRMAAERLNEESLTRGWVQAFGRELFQALAYPSGTGVVDILRYDSEAEFHAVFIRDLLAGEAERCWQYEEFRPYFDLHEADAVTGVLTAGAHHCADTLEALYDLGSLELVVSRLDDLAIESIFRDLASDAFEIPIAQVVRIARLAVAGRVRYALDSRQQALYQFVRARKEGIVIAPRSVFHILAAIAFVARHPSILRGELEVSQVIGAAPPVGVEPIVRTMRKLAAESHETIAELTGYIAELREIVPGAARPEKAARVEIINSDFAGIFLLAPLIARSRQLAEVRDSKYLLAGLALSMLGRFDPEIRSLDPAIALFAGFTEHPDMAGMRRYHTDHADARAEVEQAAVDLLTEFGSRIRGFRGAAPASIVKQFVARAGRIEVYDERIAVSLAPSPYHVALHIAGIDGHAGTLDWLCGRRLDITLEGL